MPALTDITQRMWLDAHRVEGVTQVVAPPVPGVWLSTKALEKPALECPNVVQHRALIAKFLKFLPDAEAARGKSKDRSTKVGAIVIDDDFNPRISGYNGMARGIDDDVDARHERPAKYLWAAHAEENCVAQAARVGISLKGCTILLTSLFPCTTCSRLIIQSGIKRVLAPKVTENSRWDEQAAVALEMLTEAGVDVEYYGSEE